MWGLAALFLITAGLYASVGFGGGSTYNALLVLSGADYRILPAVALACNIIVVTGGTIRFARAGHLSVRRMTPLIIASIPAAWVGGRLPISEVLFVGLLGFALLLSGLHLMVSRRAEASESAIPSLTPWPVGLPVGGAIGFLAGIVGIGGGIFLAPALYAMRWGTARQIAAACSFFILVNSLSGLAGQLTKLGDMALLSDALAYWPLLLAVLGGGQVGAWLAAGKLRVEWMKRLTALLILYVAVRLLWRWWSLL